MVKKVFCFGVFILMGLCFLSGCGNGNIKKYNVQFFSNATEWISNDFLLENKVKGAYYMTGLDEYELEIWETDQTAPSTRTYIITEEAEFKTIFTNYTDEINFENEMVLLHLLKNSGYTFNLKKINIKENTVDIYYACKKTGAYGSSMPTASCLMIRMDKLDIETAEFIKK